MLTPNLVTDLTQTIRKGRTERKGLLFFLFVSFVVQSDPLRNVS